MCLLLARLKAIAKNHSQCHKTLVLLAMLLVTLEQGALFVSRPFFSTVSQNVAQDMLDKAGLELEILLPQPCICWDPSCATYTIGFQQFPYLNHDSRHSIIL